MGTALLFMSGAALGQSPWLPQPHRLQLNPTYTFQTYDEFWMGKKKTDLPDDIDQHTFSLALDYAVFEDFALDLTVGYTWTYFSPPGEDFDDNGLTDTRIGARYRFVNEFDYASWWIPTLTVRVGAILQGTYDTGMPFAPGDGASGFETSLLLGKVFGDTGFAVNAEAGYRHRTEDVPEDFFASIGVSQTLFERLTVSVAFQHVDALSGLDIGEPKFDPSRFPEVEEDSETIQAGLGYTFNAHHHLGVFGAWTVDGRNTGEKSIVGITYHYSY